MFDLEKSIKIWKKSLRKKQAFEEGFIEELESHLRDDYYELKKNDLDNETAFRKAVENTGMGELLEREFSSRSRLFFDMNLRFPLLMNYFITAVRFFNKSRIYSMINVLGFSIGLATAVLLSLWVKDELSYDKFHTDAENIYRVDSQLDFWEESQIIPVATYPLTNIIKTEFSNMLQVTTLVHRRISLEKDNKYHYESNCLFVDSTFFDIFNFKQVAGDFKQSLKEPYNLYLSEEFTQKYFGEENPVGKNIKLNEKYDFTIAGIFENVPDNSSLKFDILASFKSRELMGEKLADWGRFDFYTYIKLHHASDKEYVSEKLFNIYEKYYEDKETKFLLQPYTEIRLNEYGNNRGMQDVLIFSSIALLIILLASINFINLSTARYSQRDKEIGMRKILGARRINIIVQIISETILISTISFFAALFIAQLCLPLFNELAGKELLLFSNGNIPFIIILSLFTVFIGIVSGVYPALFISSASPNAVLRGNLTNKGSEKGVNTNIKTRKVLTVCQFVITVVLIILTSVIYNQLDYMLNKDLGFNKEHVIYIPLNSQAGKNYDAMKNKLQSNSNFVNVTGASDVVHRFANFTTVSRWDGNEAGNRKIKLNTAHVDYNFLDFMGLEIEQGRKFSDKITSDNGKAFILNEAAVKSAAITEPIGKRMKLWRDVGTIVGVVKDFHYRSLKKEISPLLFLVEKESLSYLYVKVKSENIREAIVDLENVWEEFSSAYPFNYHFLDEEINRLYKSEINSLQVLSIFSIIAIILSCMGLLGLSAFTAETKSKEIGIRKVLGASVQDILKILISDYLKSVFIASCIAVPVAYYITSKWLENFAFTDEISVGLYILTILFTCIIAVITVVSQSISIAVKNPVNSIRTE